MGSPQTVKPHGTQSQHGSMNYLEPPPMLQEFGEPHFNPQPLQACVESRIIIVWLTGGKTNRFVRRSDLSTV